MSRSFTAASAWLVCLVCFAVAARAQDLGNAQAALARGDYAPAEVALRTLSAAGSADVFSARLHLAQLLCETGRYAQCAQTADSVEAGSPLHPQALTQRGEALEAVGKLDEAESAYRQAAADARAWRASVWLGRLLVSRGRKREATPFFMRVIDAYNQDALGGPDRAASLQYVAMAARALGHLQDANAAFRQAAVADHSRVETQLQWAALFLEKSDRKHAAQSVLDALQHNPHNPTAHVLMARMQLAQTMDFAEADAALDRALAVNPQLTAAFVTRAGMALRNMDLAAADAQLDRALAVNPTDLEALSVRAAVRFLADDSAGLAQAEQAVLARNPHFSQLYSIIADYAEWEHRYPELVAMSRKALLLDPNDTQARATLGLNLLRMGDEREGLAELKRAWEGDHFNVLVFNTLNLYEDAIGPNYERFEAKPFSIRLHKQERVVLEPYLVPLLQRAYADMRTRYAFTPEGPLSIELYAEPQHFSVRTTGLPNVGVQGVCFGKVVTGLSPRGGPYNWGQIVWHELSHVFHLQLSKNHVPRWFTEGLAEYETTTARPEWRREDDYLLWQALRANRLPSLGEMNQAFTHAHKAEDLMAAYYAASQAVAYVVQRFGWDKIRPMLVAWGQGQQTPAVVKGVLGVSLDELDKDFRAYTAERLASYASEFQVDFAAYDDVAAREAAATNAPDDPAAQAALALAYVAHSQWEQALVAARKALAHAPHDTLAHFALARVALEQRDVAKAERCLRGIVDGGADGYVLRLMLSRAALARNDLVSARSELEAAIKLEPERLEAQRGLLEVAERSKDQALGLRAIAAIAALDQHDRVVHETLVAALSQNESWQELVTEAETTLYIDPGNPALHFALGRAYANTGEPKRGLVELDRALQLGYPQPAPLQLARARVLAQLGEHKQAKAALRAAVDADPTLAAQAQAITP